MVDPLEGPKLKIERAKKQIAEVETELNSFLVSDFYRLYSKADVDKSQSVYEIKFINDIPAIVPVICGEALHSLRSALDLAVNAVLLNKFGVPDISKGGFPIEGSRAKFEASAQYRKINRFAKFGRLVDKLQPYHGGNELFWQLHLLNATDKHKMLVTASLPTQKTLPQVMNGKGDLAVINIPFWQTRGTGETLQDTIGKLAGKLAEKISPVFRVSFAEIEGIKSKDILAVLREICALTENTIKEFEFGLD
jgi:hypothetical protein